MTTRVLYLMANATAGGAERATLLMLSSHDRQRYEPGVLFFRPGPLVSDAAALGIDVQLLPVVPRLRRPLSMARAVMHTRRLIRDGGYSLVHSCMAYAHLVGGAASYLAGVPAVLYQHGPLGPWMDGAATMVRCDRILANSRFTASDQRTRSWRRRPITIAPPAVALERPAGLDRAAMRARVNETHGIPAGAAVIGMTARLDPWKGIDVAIRAAAPLLRERPDVRFLLVGGRYGDFHAGYEKSLRALAEREGIGSRVVFAGFQADVRPYLARMSVLVHASVQAEPFGLTLLEAMACGVPVVAAHAGGAAEIVEQGVNGMTHAPGDEAGLRDALQAALDDAGLRERLIAGGLRTVEERYRPAHMMRTIEGAYDEILETRVRPLHPVARATARNS